MYCVTARNRFHHNKYTIHLHQLHLFKVVIQIKIRQHEETMGDCFQKLHYITAKKHGIMREIAHHQQPTSTLDHSHYKWDSPWPKPQSRHQSPIALTQTGSSCTCAQPSVPSETRTLSKTSNPVVQESNLGPIQMVDTKTTTTPRNLKC